METITRPSPIIVQAVQKPGQPRYRHLMMPIAILTDPKGNVLRTPSGAIRYQYGKIYGPRVEKRMVDGIEKEVEVPGQKFEYVGDPAQLEDDPHLVVIDDPDGRVDQAIADRERKQIQAEEAAKAHAAEKKARRAKLAAKPAKPT